MSETIKTNGRAENMAALVTVLMCNDAVIGVYDSEEKAEQAGKDYHEERFKEEWRCPSWIRVSTEEGKEEFRRWCRSQFYIHRKQVFINAKPSL